MANKKFGIVEIPLLKHVLKDRHVKIRQRAIDNDWFYNGVFSNIVSGFNPSHRTIYISYQSHLARWLRNGQKKEFKYNDALLAKEALFLIHDYLHCWAYLMIQELLPNLRFGYGKINKKNIETYVFCHLLTEAAATVGLDYWYLSTLGSLQLNALGLSQRGLTVGYHEDFLPEYQKFNPKFTAQNVEMFESVATFYCTGKLPFFKISDMKKSPILKKWLKHELNYGQKQRIYTREWLSYLSDEKIQFNGNRLAKEVVIVKAWQKKLMRRLGEELWALVKNDKPTQFKKISVKTRSWKKAKISIPDFRFTNLNGLNLNKVKLIKKAPNYEDNFRFFYLQYLSSFNYRDTPKEFLKIFGSFTSDNLDDLLKLTRVFKLKKCKGPKSEPIDLFFLN